MSRRRKLNPDEFRNPEGDDRPHRSRSRDPEPFGRWDQEDDPLDEDEFDPIELEEEWLDRLDPRTRSSDEDYDEEDDPLSW